MVVLAFAVDFITVLYFSFLLERDYVVTFGSSLSQIRLSPVTFVHPTQGVETFGNISSPFCTLAFDFPAKFYGDHPRGTRPSGR